MLVTVTQEHINEGNLSDSYGCPLALAMKAKGLKGVAVGTSIAYEGWSGPGGPKPHRKWLLPIEATALVVDFDNGKSTTNVRPRTFRFRRIST